MRLSGLDGVIEIRRDRWGAPHITAQTRHDLWFAQGFCQGQDRLWQLELYRRVADRAAGGDRRAGRGAFGSVHAHARPGSRRTTGGRGGR